MNGVDMLQPILFERNNFPAVQTLGHPSTCELCVFVIGLIQAHDITTSIYLENFIVFGYFLSFERGAVITNGNSVVTDAETNVL